MLREFFCAREPRVLCIAWGGLLLVLAHAAAHGWIKWAVNGWFKSFYDLLQEAGSLSTSPNVTVIEWKEHQALVLGDLLEFCKIATVAVVVMPIAKYIRSAWSLHWRMALMRAYVDHWDPNKTAIEGASQRVHEDSYKFSKGIEMCLTTVLDSLISLGVFIPVLIELGAATPAPRVVGIFAAFGEEWLVAIACASALVGFLVTMLLGHKLVGLEIENQKIEANLRRTLVILETSPHSLCQPVHSHEEASVLLPPAPQFRTLFTEIQVNYNRLFVNFGVLNLWLALFDQFNTILPYLLFAPLLFSPNAFERIQLGTLIQVSNSFDKVFGSLSVVAENWAGVNEFRSVLVRLSQYEQNVYHSLPHPNAHTSTSTTANLFARGRRATTAEFAPAEIETETRV